MSAIDAQRGETGLPDAPGAAATRFAVSRDGTRIAYSRQGSGAAVILVDGALCHRKMGPSAALAKCLAGRFTVFTYDRRGRGESGDTQPYAPEREVEDIAAILAAAGGAACLWGTSSGGLLAIAAASRLPGIRRLAFYEAPAIVDTTRAGTEKDWEAMRRALADGRRGRAVRRFLVSVGMPPVVALLMQLAPFWRGLTAVAPTLAYDAEIVTPVQRRRPLEQGPWNRVAVPTLVTDGGASPVWMRNGNKALADAIPGAAYRTLDGQTHALKAELYAPLLAEFFGAAD